MRNSMLITRVSSLAIAAALTAAASAQSLLGDHNVTFGSVNVLHGTGTTDLFVESQTAVLDWTPDDNVVGGGTIIFQDAGTTATFFGSPNFAVLNRINVADPNRVVALNGMINSIVGESTGGNIFFYSPSGFVVGSSAVINVGSLVLSASPIAVDGNGNFLSGTSVTFNQATNPNAAITTVAGSQINAFGAGSYVALVAPQITHSGTIRTDRAAAVVAAEAATINFSPDGLFDIQVTVGANTGDRLHIDGGTITRNVNTPEGTSHLAYLVAVAKNDAVTMLIENGGSVGFETATSATVENNVVILSGGDVVDGTPVVGNSDNRVDLAIDNSSFSSHVRGDFNGSVDIRTSSGDTSFGRNLALTASQDSIITAINGNRLSIGGDLTVNLDESGFGADTSGNLLRLSANGTGSSLIIGGNALLSSQVTGFGEGQSGVDAADVTGGTVIVQSGSGSTIGIRGSLTIDVDAEGGVHGGSSASAGSATGGTAHLLANGGNGSSITIGGSVDISANAVGGGFEECSVCSITGGEGTGGTILLQAMTGTGNLLDIGGSVSLDATGDGGAGDVTGGTGRGGTAQLVVGDTSSIMIRDDLGVDVSAFGGFGSSDGTQPGLGGNAFGGNAAIQFQGSPSNGSIALTGISSFTADASGGNGKTGGNATGGWVDLQVSANGTLTADFLGLSANASGGDSDPFDQGSGATGGSATGGRAWLQASSGGDIILDSLSLSANAFGGTGNSGNGGAATGGHVIASANNGTLTVANLTDLEANGRGGLAEDDGDVGGLGTGGEANVIAANGGSVDFNGVLAVNVDGFGGNYFSDGSTGGNGVGGQILLRADGATLDTATDVSLSAIGYGGFSFADCSFCGGTGGDGTGGTIDIDAIGGATGQLLLRGNLTAQADGEASGGLAGPGGDGQGGTVRLSVRGGATAHMFGDMLLSAIGNGGGQRDGLAAGHGTGGTVDAFVGITGGILTIDGFSDLTASGFGGEVLGEGGIGGSGTGGTASFAALGGTATFAGLSVDARGTGGNTESGTGGTGTGNQARIDAIGGDITINGSAFVDVTGIGGNGTIGGDGIGGGDFFTSRLGARIYARNGDIIVNGSALAFADGVGGNGANGGGGGDGTGGWASIHAASGDGGPSLIRQQGDIESSAVASASGFGGDGGGGLPGTDGASGAAGTNGGTGGQGGAGGTGTGGVAAITAGAGNGTIDIGFGFAEASGMGGDGGFGGDGGDGGFGSNGPGGNGGAGGLGGLGGAAFGGFATFGVEVGDNPTAATGLNSGTANFAFVEARANGEGGFGGGGGFGGAGGFGTPGGTAGANGSGGAGGDARGGTALLQARGGTVAGNFISLTANAIGGDGGIGATDGAGGDAESDEAMVLVTNRQGNIALRGSLNVDTIQAVVDSAGGLGSTPGAGMMEGGSGFIVVNGDATIGSLDFNVSAPDGPILDSASEAIAIVNGDVDVSGGFSFATSGRVSVLADNGSLTAGTISIGADNFVHDEERPLPATIGTISADSIALATNGDLIVDAHLISTGSLDLIAPGLVDVADATSGANLTLGAGSSISGGTMTATNLVTAAAPGNIGLNLVIAGTDIDLQSTGGSIATNAQSAGGSILLDGLAGISTGDLTAGGSVQATSAGAVTIGNIGAGGSVEISAGPLIQVGNIQAGQFIALSADTILGGNMTAGGFIDLFAGGPATINVGNLSGDGIYLTSIGNITTGTIDSTLDVEATSFDGSITTSHITAATDVTLAAADAIATGNISAGGTLSLTGSSLALGDLTGNFLNLTSTLGNISTGDVVAFGDLNVASASDFLFGSITAQLVEFNIPGSIAGGFIDSGGNLTAVAGGDIDVGNLTAGGFNGEGFDFGDILLSAGGDIATGDATALGLIDVLTSGGAIQMGNLLALTKIDLEASGGIGFGNAEADELDFDSGGAVTGGNIVAGTFVGGTAQGAVSLGDISVGTEQLGGPTEDGFAVGIASATSINVGNVEADEAIGFATFGNLVTGNLSAGTDVMTLVGGNTTIASILAPGRTYHGDAQMFIDAGGTDNFDPNLIFAQSPVRSGGSYTITGAISTGQLQVAASSITTGGITAFDSATLDASGSVSTGAIDAGSLRVVAGGNITTGDIFAFDGVGLDAGGSILTGDITAFIIDLLAGTDISTGDLTTQAGDVQALLFPGASITLEAGGDIATGDISSRDGVYVEAGGSISTGAIAAVDFVEAHGVDGVTTGDIDAGDYVLLTSDNGAISVASASTPGSFQATARTSLTAGTVSANTIGASAGGTATIGGGWSAGDVRLTSNDIDIAATGSISAGDISLVSTNATRTIVGDGIQLAGYQLSNAEYNRLNANDINVIADAGLGAAPSMLIGDLNVNASSDPDINDYEFITGNGETETAGGSIRILGDMVFTGMTADEAVSFTTGTFELDAATGLLSLENTPGTLGGTLFLNAANIHVATGEILDRLALAPQYDGYQDELNAPAAVQRTDGVIRAGSVEIEFGEAGLNTLFVQNTGTDETPAGFLISDLNLGDAGEAGLPANSIDLIINGQVVTSGGTLTGIDVRDLLVEGRDLAPFTGNSTINGCLLTGSCGEGPFPPGFTPTPGIQTEIRLITDNLLPPPEFDNEDFIDDNNEITLEGQTSPIKPPHPLFDTSELGAKGDIDDPVSGSGNPALMESGESAACPAGASQQTGTCKQEKQP